MSYMKCEMLFLATLALAASGLLSTPTIRVKSGELRGVVSMDGLLRYHYFYLGIPYGKAQDRFQVGKPVRWDGVFEATNDNIRCSQKSWLEILLRTETNLISGQEDCLTLNVYTPASEPTQSGRMESLKPVMVFIHGGGFRGGAISSGIYGPQYFLRHDVIVVSINYRLDILGFLCLGIKEAPGNIGMKDQVQALKWVKENIESFGGDPNNITIFGQSAGSASVMYHLVSPMSQGLFVRAIMQSGAAASPWSFQFEPLKIASQFAKQMGYESEDPKELYTFFLNKTAEELLRTRLPRANGTIYQSENIFVPCAEKEIPDEEAFLTESPYNMIASGRYVKIPMIIGHTDKEGYYFVGRENETTIENMNFYASLPKDLKFPSEEEANKTANKLKELYMGNKEVSGSTLLELADYEGDCGITYPVTAMADLIVRTNDQVTFLYKFAYSGTLNLIKMESGFASAPGATHADDILYMFKPMLAGLGRLLENDIIDKMTTMWTNFAKFGNPTPLDNNRLQPWEPANKNEPTVLVINRQFSTAPLWDSEKLRFWNETYSLYRRMD